MPTAARQFARRSAAADPQPQGQPPTAFSPPHDPEAPELTLSEPNLDDAILRDPSHATSPGQNVFSLLTAEIAALQTELTRAETDLRGALAATLRARADMLELAAPQQPSLQILQGGESALAQAVLIAQCRCPQQAATKDLTLGNSAPGRLTRSIPFALLGTDAGDADE